MVKLSKAGFNNTKRNVSSYTPAALFSGGANGVWYDPSDLSTMFQDTAGTIPAVVGQPVGLLLDKRLGLVRGAELVPSLNFASGWTFTGSPAATADDADSFTKGGTEGAGGAWKPILTAGKVYEFSLTYTTVSGGILSVRSSTIGSDLYSSSAASGTLSGTFVASTAEFYLRLSANGTLNVTSISVREISGNHATQATAASRPILRQDSNGKYYLEFDGLDDTLTKAFTIAQPWSRMSAIRQITWTDGDRLFGDVASAGVGSLYQRTTTNQLRIYSGVLSVGPTTGLNLTTSYVVTERHSGATSLLQINNATAIVNDAGAFNTDGIAIGSSAGSSFANFRLYGVIMVGKTLTDWETNYVRRYLGNKIGTVL